MQKNVFGYCYCFCVSNIITYFTYLCFTGISPPYSSLFLMSAICQSEMEQMTTLTIKVLTFVNTPLKQIALVISQICSSAPLCQILDASHTGFLQTAGLSSLWAAETNGFLLCVLLDFSLIWTPEIMSLVN